MAPITSKKGLTTTNYNDYSMNTSNDEQIDSPNSNSPTPSSQPSSTDPGKSQCSSLGSDCEFFEGYGVNSEGILRSNNGSDGNNNLNAAGGIGVGSSGGAVGVELDLAPQNDVGDPCANSTIVYGDDHLNLASRDNWTRRSLRRTQPSNPEVSHRRWGSMRHSGRRQITTNALASQLYRSSSFNSSGPSSNGDTTEDMYSDISLENVQDINYKVCILESLNYFAFATYGSVIAYVRMYLLH